MSKYNNIYLYIKEQITTNQISTGEKLPSIRKAANLFGVSRTTIENAYFELAADGFIISEPQSGYYVSKISEIKENENQVEQAESTLLYDFENGKADKESFDFSNWRRYIKNALKEDEKLLSYGEPQGECELRLALSNYIRDSRNVVAAPNRIVVGSGTQSLLSILCSLINEKSTVSFPDKSFIQGASLFEDYGFDVHYRFKDAKIIYVSPSHMTRWGDVMPNKRRIELINYSAKENSLIIEDDYESDFLYNRPTPSLHALANGKNVVYIGSFSRLLLPSIRISFMVLTEELAEIYRKNIFKYSQTASKTEQIALCQFIRDGHLTSQIKKTRRFYTTKTKDFYNLLKSNLKNAKIKISENNLQIIVSIPFNKDISVFEENNISVYIEKYEKGILTFVINSSSLPKDDFEKAINALKFVLL